MKFSNKIKPGLFARAVFFLAPVILLYSCAGPASEDGSEGTEMTVIVESAEEMGNTTKEILESPVITDPQEFLPYIQKAIRMDTLELMRELCHPDQTRIRYGNAFTVCGIRTADMKDIDKFKGWFGPASLTGEITLDADTAYLPTVLGENERHPTIILEKMDDRWYLVGMEWNQ